MEPLRGFSRPDIKAVTSAVNSNQASMSNTKLVPVGEVARQLGYRDPRNFRLSVAPRIGLAVVRVGLRWFVAERDFAFEGGHLFRDPETGEELLGDAPALRAEYLERFAAARAALAAELQASGIRHTTHVIDEALDAPLRRLFGRAQLQREEVNILRGMLTAWDRKGTVLQRQSPSDPLPKAQAAGSQGAETGSQGEVSGDKS